MKRESEVGKTSNSTAAKKETSSKGFLVS